MDEPFCMTLTRLLFVFSLWSLGCATRVTGSEGGDPGAPPTDALVPPRDVATLDRAADSLEDRGADQGADGGDAVDASDRLDARADLVAADAATDALSRADIICDRPPRQDVGGAGLVLCTYGLGEPLVCSSETGCALLFSPGCEIGNAKHATILRCDGGEDCAEGEFCCRTMSPYRRVYCVPRPMCQVFPSGSGILCHQDADCPCDLPRCCGRADFVTVRDSPYRTCVATCDGG